MSITTIRAQLKTNLLTVSGIGSVNDFKRYVNQWDSYKDLFIKDERVNTWEIERTGFEAMARGGDGKVEDMNHELTIRGFYGLYDQFETARTFDELIDAIIAVIIQNPTLTGTAKIVHIPMRGEMKFGNLGQVLCHIVEIKIQVEERTFL